VKHSDPIPIATRSGRGRSGSMSSASSGSASSPSELQTPLSGSGNSQRVTIPSPGSSPILSYFLQSPTKSPGANTFPFRKFTSPVLEEDEQKEPASAFHARRASTVVAGRFGQQPQNTLPDPHVERGAGLLRRLSLSSAAFGKPDPQSFSPASPPNAPPNSAVSPVASNLPFPRDSKPRRSATISVTEKSRRAPSPMGERILKGHFDGFN